MTSSSTKSPRFIGASNGAWPLSKFEQMLLRRFSPAAVLAHPQGDILSINGRTGKYLEPPSGQLNWNIFAMAREELTRLRAGDAAVAPPKRLGPYHSADP